MLKQGECRAKRLEQRRAMAIIAGLLLPATLTAQGSAVLDLRMLGNKGLALEAPMAGSNGVGELGALGDFNGDGFSDLALRFVQGRNPTLASGAIVYGRAAGSGRQEIGNALPGSTILEIGQPARLRGVLSAAFERAHCSSHCSRGARANSLGLRGTSTKSDHPTLRRAMQMLVSSK